MKTKSQDIDTAGKILDHLFFHDLISLKQNTESQAAIMALHNDLKRPIADRNATIGLEIRMVLTRVKNKVDFLRAA